MLAAGREQSPPFLRYRNAQAALASAAQEAANLVGMLRAMVPLYERTVYVCVYVFLNVRTSVYFNE